MAPIFENADLLAHTCGLLDAVAIAKLCMTCRFVPKSIGDARSMQFVASMRTDVALAGLSTIERLALVEALRETGNCIEFREFDCELLDTSVEPLKRFAALMKRHRSFSVSIEAHCGLEAPRNAAYMFARERGRNVQRALVSMGVELERFSIMSYGNRRPLIWAHGDPEARPNRRVELYVRSPDGFEVPARRAADGYARPPRLYGDYRPGEAAYEIGSDGPGILDGRRPASCLYSGRLLRHGSAQVATRWMTTSLMPSTSIMQHRRPLAAPRATSPTTMSRRLPTPKRRRSRKKISSYPEKKAARRF